MAPRTRRDSSRDADAVKLRAISLTPLRRCILDLVVKAEQPIKAYDLLDRLRLERQKAVPATVYRSLNFLIAEGLVHKLATGSRYVACLYPGELHDASFLVCESCGTVKEIRTNLTSLVESAEADAWGFRANARTVEIRGVCGDCLDRGSP